MTTFSPKSDLCVLRCDKHSSRTDLHQEQQNRNEQRNEQKDEQRSKQRNVRRNEQKDEQRIQQLQQLALERLGTTDDFEQFLRDACLTRFVVNQRQGLNQFLGIGGGIAHRIHTGSQL